MSVLKRGLPGAVFVAQLVLRPLSGGRKLLNPCKIESRRLIQRNTMPYKVPRIGRIRT